jgi:hypothetical protein
VDFPVIYDQGVCGVAALDEVRANDGFIFIPSTCVISVPMIKSQAFMQGIIKECKDIFEEEADGDFLLMAAFLTFESLKGEKSEWKPYIDVMTAPSMPPDWTRD